ncbi:MAG: DUF5946 family protein [Aggregatilineales bacterium]
MERRTCVDCGAVYGTDDNCEAYFHQLLYWEWEYDLQAVHHLLVLCYHLQHPRLYSPETLENSKQMLVQFVEGGVTPQMMRQQMRDDVDSGKRTHKITGTVDSYGAYVHPVNWTMTVVDVVNAGHEVYYESVQKWAKSMLKSLRESGNL